MEAAGATDESDDLGLLGGGEDKSAEGKDKPGDGSGEIGDAQKVMTDQLDGVREAGYCPVVRGRC